MAEYNVVAEFEAGTHCDNELLLQLVLELEKCLPTDSSVSDLVAQEGDVSFKLTTGWREAVKNEVADVLVTLSALDYVHGLSIDSFAEDYAVVFITGYDEESGEPIYLREEAEEGHPEDSGEYVQVGPDDEIPEEYLEFEYTTLVKTEYDITFHISEPVAIEETEDAESTEEGGEE